jgi:5,10-methenyltetrahydrofolate synthetase
MISPDIAVWRQAERQRLLNWRRNLPLSERKALAQSMLANLSALLQRRKLKMLGIYSPIQREIDIRPLAAQLSDSRGILLALPVVVRKAAPLEYWSWRPGEPMQRGFWNILVPARREVVNPDTIIAPLVGFERCYRLGYGGGYFDRTLLSAEPRPYAIGLGFEATRLNGFIAQSHDVPMDVIVTDAAIHDHAHSGANRAHP